MFTTLVPLTLTLLLATMAPALAQAEPQADDALTCAAYFIHVSIWYAHQGDEARQHATFPLADAARTRGAAVLGQQEATRRQLAAFGHLFDRMGRDRRRTPELIAQYDSVCTGLAREVQASPPQREAVPPDHDEDLTACVAYYQILDSLYAGRGEASTVNAWRLEVAKQAFSTVVGDDQTARRRLAVARARLAFTFEGDMVGIHRLKNTYEASCTALLLPLIQ
jgi:hypothetical protein